MNQDTLFLLRHDFLDGPGKPYYCPECAQINGVLHYFPELRHHLNVRYVDFPKPRPEIVALVGEEHQGCPVLVLADKPVARAAGVEFGTALNRYFVSGASNIGQYLSKVYGVGRPH